VINHLSVRFRSQFLSFRPVLWP